MEIIFRVSRRSGRSRDAGSDPRNGGARMLGEAWIFGGWLDNRDYAGRLVVTQPEFLAVPLPQFLPDLWSYDKQVTSTRAPAGKIAVDERKRAIVKVNRRCSSRISRYSVVFHASGIDRVSSQLLTTFSFTHSFYFASNFRSV